MYQQKVKTNPQRASFIKTVVEAAGIKVCKARILKRARDGRDYPQHVGFGFTRFIGSEEKDGAILERSARYYPTEGDAYEAAHAHYRLRAA